MAYQYERLDDPSKQIRLAVVQPGAFDDLLKIKFLIRNLDEKEPAYEALSYVWGLRENPSSVIVGDTIRESESSAAFGRTEDSAGSKEHGLNSSTGIWKGASPGRKAVPLEPGDQARIEITHNLDIAMRHFRYPDESRTIWIDALCINQNDVQERSEQVGHMREIYSNANEVVIWLGPCFEGSNKLFAYMREHEAQCFVGKANGETCVVPPRTELRLPLSTLIRLPYWTRYWIVQEFVLARNARILCGFESVNRADFLSMINEYSSPSTGHFISTALAMGPRDHHVVGGIVKIVNWQRQEPSIHLAEAMNRTRTNDATDPRDKVFAILGLVTKGAGQSIAVDYTHPPCTVYCTAIEAMMKDRQDMDDRRELDDFTMQSFVSNTMQCRTAIDGISPECRKAEAYGAFTALFCAPIYADEGTEVKHQCDGIKCGSRAAMWLVAGWHIWGTMKKEGEGENLWN